jgi:hypothetical protein
MPVTVHDRQAIASLVMAEQYHGLRVVTSSHVIYVMVHTSVILYHNLKEFHFLHPSQSHRKFKSDYPGRYHSNIYPSEDITKLGIFI